MAGVDLTVGKSWRAAHPDAMVGLLAMRGLTPSPNGGAALADACGVLEARLRERFGGRSRQEIAATPPLPAYAAYYKRWKKSYHVLLQLESVALKGRSIPRVTPVVQAAFMAELDSLLLTAAHDLDTVRPPLRLLAAAGGEQYTLLSGDEAALKVGDMAMADAAGVICSVLSGQDRRTRITDASRRALFVVYAPPGIPCNTLDVYLDLLRRYVRLAAPDAEVDGRSVVTAAG